MRLTAEDMVGLLQVQHLYGHVLDRFLWEKLDEVFAPDGVFDPSDVGLPVMRGLAEIRAKLIPLEEGENRDNVHNHVATNPAVISVGEDGVVKMRTKYIVSSQRDFLAFGEYEDELVKTPTGWRIKYRKTRRLTGHNLPYLAAPPKYETPEGPRGG
ncbi:MAG: nuclear transport factor 2 family protein [Caulobacteraceae bacterium]|nr:nuclear transport factor 2 family protein [Caulobacteraceae bacterium]